MTGNLAHNMTISGAVLLVCVAPATGAFASYGWARTARLQPIGSYTSDGTPWRAVDTRAAKPDTVISTPSVSEMVGALRDRGMPIAGIAELARVERKSVYAWLDGAEVRPVNEARMTALHANLASWGGDLRELRRVWNRPLASGASLHDLLVAEALDGAAIQAAMTELRPAVDRRARQEALRSVAGRNGRNPILDEIAVADLG